MAQKGISGELPDNWLLARISRSCVPLGLFVPMHTIMITNPIQSRALERISRHIERCWHPVDERQNAAGAGIAPSASLSSWAPRSVSREARRNVTRVDGHGLAHPRFHGSAFPDRATASR